MCTRKGYIRSETYRVTTAGIPCGMTCDPNYHARIELLVNPTGHGPSYRVGDLGTVYHVSTVWYQDTFPLLIQRLQSRSHAHRLSDACSAVGRRLSPGNEYRVTGPGERTGSSN